MRLGGKSVVWNFVTKSKDGERITCDKEYEEKVVSSFHCYLGEAISIPQTFVQWYSLEKVSMQEEFPELGPAELTKIAMKRYKEMRAKSLEQKQPEVQQKPEAQQNSNGNHENSVIENGTNETVEEDNCTKTVIQESKINTEESNSKVVERSKMEQDTSNTKMTEENSKKRKAASEELREIVKKPSSSSSKLSAFLFKKNT